MLDLLVRIGLLLVRQLVLVAHGVVAPVFSLAPGPAVACRRDSEREEDGQPMAVEVRSVSSIACKEKDRDGLSALARSTNVEELAEVLAPAEVVRVQEGAAARESDFAIPVCSRKASQIMHLGKTRESRTVIA